MISKNIFFAVLLLTSHFTFAGENVAVSYKCSNTEQPTSSTKYSCMALYHNSDAQITTMEFGKVNWRSNDCFVLVASRDPYIGVRGDRRFMYVNNNQYLRDFGAFGFNGVTSKLKLNPAEIPVSFDKTLFLRDGFGTSAYVSSSVLQNGVPTATKSAVLDFIGIRKIDGDVAIKEYEKYYCNRSFVENIPD